MNRYPDTPAVGNSSKTTVAASVIVTPRKSTASYASGTSPGETLEEKIARVMSGNYMNKRTSPPVSNPPAAVMIGGGGGGGNGTAASQSENARQPLQVIDK